jgi:nucleoside-diphosphate-sugar epimerase
MSTAGANPPIVAVTGATGFIGKRLVPALHAAGWQTRLLMRRDPVIAEWRDVRPEIVAGDIAQTAALERLVAGASAVIHVAGLIKAARREQFFAVNHAATADFARVVSRVAPQAHFLLLSTVAAREPRLSDYAASKRAGEDAAREIIGPRATVLRPTAVYGPGDRETLAFFQIAQLKRIPLLGRADAQATLIHVDDLVSLIVALAAEAPRGAVLTACDERSEGYRWHEVFAAASNAVGNKRGRMFHAPAPLLRTVALAGDIGKLFGSSNMLNSQKLRELRHPDWSVHEAERARANGWSPRFTLEAGFVDAVDWYRKAGWLA